MWEEGYAWPRIWRQHYVLLFWPYVSCFDTCSLLSNMVITNFRAIRSISKETRTAHFWLSAKRVTSNQARARCWLRTELRRKQTHMSTVLSIGTHTHTRLCYFVKICPAFTWNDVLCCNKSDEMFLRLCKTVDLTSFVLLFFKRRQSRIIPNRTCCTNWVDKVSNYNISTNAGHLCFFTWSGFVLLIVMLTSFTFDEHPSTIISWTSGLLFADVW